ncbi:MAG: response regulator, partial [Clostridia bacterium]
MNHKVLIVEDEILALRNLLGLVDWEKEGFTVCGAVMNAKEALAVYKKTTPQILIVDIGLPGMNGLELSKQIIELNPNVYVILLTAFKDFNYAKEAVNLGINRYLLKNELTEETLIVELKEAVRDLI